MWKSCHSTFSSWNVSSWNAEWQLTVRCLTWTSSKYKAHLYFLCAKKLWRCDLFWQTLSDTTLICCKKHVLFRSGTLETFHVKHAKDNRSRHAHWWWVRPGLENIIFLFNRAQSHSSNQMKWSSCIRRLLCDLVSLFAELIWGSGSQEGETPACST